MKHQCKWHVRWSWDKDYIADCYHKEGNPLMLDITYDDCPSEGGSSYVQFCPMCGYKGPLLVLLPLAIKEMK
jgi:hypothetical protein